MWSHTSAQELNDVEQSVGAGLLVMLIAPGGIRRSSSRYAPTPARCRRRCRCSCPKHCLRCRSCSTPVGWGSMFHRTPGGSRACTSFLSTAPLRKPGASSGFSNSCKQNPKHGICQLVANNESNEQRKEHLRSSWCAWSDSWTPDP